MRTIAAFRIRKRVTGMILAAAVLFTAAAVPLPVNAMSNEEATFFYLTDTLGFNVAAACGIMANIRHESNFTPGSYGGGGSYGLCQWTGGRRSWCESYCWDNGFGDDSLYGQLSFLTHELRTVYPGIYNYLMNVENSSEGAYNAAYEFCYDYERPANKGSRSAARGSLAAGTYWRKYEIYAYDMWINTDKGVAYHYTDGSLHYGWLDLDDEMYYCDQDGILTFGLFSADGSTYFADSDGILQYGWQEIGDSTYCFDDETGAMKVGWTNVDGKPIYYDSNGQFAGVNAFNEKAGITDDEIETMISEKEAELYITINAPASDPMPLPDKLMDVAVSIQKAGADSQNLAAAAATPGKDSMLTSSDLPPSSAVKGLVIDTKELEAGTDSRDDAASGRITFKGVQQQPR